MICQCRNHRTNIAIGQIDIQNCGFDAFCCDERQGLSNRSGRTEDDSAGILDRVSQI